MKENLSFKFYSLDRIVNIEVINKLISKDPMKWKEVGWQNLSSKDRELAVSSTIFHLVERKGKSTIIAPINV